MQMLMGQGVTRRINTQQGVSCKPEGGRKERPFCGGGARKNSHTVAPTSESVVRTPSLRVDQPLLINQHWHHFTGMVAVTNGRIVTVIRHHDQAIIWLHRLNKPGKVTVPTTCKRSA